MEVRVNEAALGALCLLVVCCSTPADDDPSPVDAGVDARPDVSVSGTDADASEPSPLTIAPADLQIARGFSLTLRVVSSGDESPEWEALSDTITVDDDGRLTGVSAGAFVVRATADGRVGELSGRVVEPAWKEIDTGLDTSCAISGEGQLYCFGITGFVRDDPYLPLATSTPELVSTPEAAVDVALTWGAICFVGASGKTYCRGLNFAGQLADGTLWPRTDWQEIAYKPGTAQAERRLEKLVAGERHFCGLSPAGSVFCWGSLAAGTVGANRRATRMGDLEYVDIGSGDWHACARTGEGALHCWGSNVSFQLGDRSQEWASSPQRVTDDRDFDLVTGGRYHSCATSDGEVSCWGSEEFGALGFETRTGVQLEPRGNRVARVRQIDGAFFATCAVDVFGRRTCWGRNDHALVGDGSIGEPTEPRTDDEQLWWKVAMATLHACGLTVAGELLCWGADAYGATGSARQLLHPEPRRVGSGYVSVSAGGSHTCAIADNGRLKCWGDNRHNQLGLGHDVWTPFPSRIAAPEQWTDVASARATTCGIAADGLYCWGLSLAGALGLYDVRLAKIPSQVDLRDVDRIVAGGRHYLAHHSTGWSVWGDNREGQLMWSPDSLDSPSGARDIIHDGTAYSPREMDGGSSHSCVILEETDGVAYCFGESADYRNGPDSNSASIAQLPGQWEEVSAGHAHTCGVTTSGEVVCYGALDLGASATDQPIAITGSFEDLSSRGPFTCGIAPDGASCWGSNFWGNVGVESSAAVLTPTAIRTPEPIRQVSVGTRHACGITDSGDLYCWGDDGLGQVGTESGRIVLKPTPVGAED